MKKLLFLLILVGILSVNSVVNAEIITIKSGSIINKDVSLKTTFVNQDPYPSDPGSYVKLVFKLENWGTEKAENVVFELLPEYPFSLDTGVNANNELGNINGMQNGQNAFLIKYKVRVDKDAINGENEIGVKVKYNNGVVVTDTFNVTVSNPRTDFDVVTQDSTTSSTTLAIANIGANTAYSVIVRIPGQENFRTTGTSASVIGNLNAGDYTLVSFQITSNTGIGNFTGTRGNIPPYNITGTGENVQQNRPSNRTTINMSMIREGNLAVEIDYTDTLGIRRILQKEVSLNMGNVSGTGTRTRSTTQGSQLQIPNGGLMYIAIGVVGIIVIVVFFKFRKRKKK